MNSSRMEKISFFCDEALDFFVLNILWVLGTLLGGGVFGWAPSTIALLTVLRDKIMTNEKGRAASIFVKTYKKEFKKGNLLGLIITFFAYIIFINQLNFTANDGSFFTILSAFSTIAKWVLIGVTLYVFPMYVHYETSIKNYFIKSFAFILLKPHITVCLTLWCWLFYSFILQIPGLIPFVSLSLFAFGVMAINYHLFMKNEYHLEKESTEKMK